MCKGLFGAPQLLLELLVLLLQLYSLLLGAELSLSAAVGRQLHLLQLSPAGETKVYQSVQTNLSSEKSAEDSVTTGVRQEVSDLV